MNTRTPHKPSTLYATPGRSGVYTVTTAGRNYVVQEPVAEARRIRRSPFRRTAGVLPAIGVGASVGIGVAGSGALIYFAVMWIVDNLALILGAAATVAVALTLSMGSGRKSGYGYHWTRCNR